MLPMGQIRLTDFAGDDRNPYWAPDGTLIFFTRDGVPYVMNADGSNPQPQ
jgi:Tol biopolymer transport system component